MYTVTRNVRKSMRGGGYYDKQGSREREGRVQMRWENRKFYRFRPRGADEEKIEGMRGDSPLSNSPG